MRGRYRISRISVKHVRSSHFLLIKILVDEVWWYGEGKYIKHKLLAADSSSSSPNVVVVCSFVPLSS